ncbi:MAG: reverse gyrase, partial [bacterium]
SGIRADLVNAKSIESFKNKRLQVLVGLASYNSPLARGLDLPEVVRYALFIGIPRFEITLRYKENPSALCSLFRNLLPWLIKRNLLDKIMLRELSQDLSKLRNFKVSSYSELPENLRQKALNMKDLAESLFSNSEILSLIENSDEIAIRIRRGEQGVEPIAIIPDISGYIQASGRTSRLYMGRLTKGLSYILVDDRKALSALKRRLVWSSEDIELKEAKGINLEEILYQIDEDRKRQMSNVDLKEKIKTDLVVVESPNKARTISQFFGKPSRRRVGGIDVYEIPLQDRYLTIVASKGHLVDLNKEEGIYGVIPQNSKFIPLFETIDPSREDIVRAIREISLEVDEVFIATDPDTEGEKIAYDIYLALRPYQKDIKRTEFHEVTKRAFLEALKNSREINLNLVKAQLLRRIADRWIGFEVSLYVQRRLGKSNLSAGRVQTPVLEWIVERSKEARKKLYVVRAEIDGLSVDFDFQNKKEAEEFYSRLKEVELEEISRWQEDLSVRPLNTPALLKEASINLRFSPQKTMDLAQDLFEAGFITYHRTDSIRVSQVGVNVATSYIKENFGDEFVYIRTYSEAGGAHECIRPTRAIDAEELFSETFLNLERLTKDHIRLYDLIFKYFIASQMRAVSVEKRRIKFKAMSKEREEEFITDIIKDGFNLIIPIHTRPLDLDKKILVVTGKKILQRPVVSYFTYASLIEEMRNKGIGRPSTYAITVQKLFERGYIIERYGNLLPTPLGIKVYSTIKDSQKFYDFVNEDYTRELEEQMDRVEDNGELYVEYLQVLYNKIIQRLHRALPGKSIKETFIKPKNLNRLLE